MRDAAEEGAGSGAPRPVGARVSRRPAPDGGGRECEAALKRRRIARPQDFSSTDPAAVRSLPHHRPPPAQQSPLHLLRQCLLVLHRRLFSSTWPRGKSVQGQAAGPSAPSARPLCSTRWVWPGLSCAPQPHFSFLSLASRRRISASSLAPRSPPPLPETEPLS